MWSTGEVRNFGSRWNTQSSSVSHSDKSKMWPGESMAKVEMKGLLQEDVKELNDWYIGWRIMMGADEDIIYPFTARLPTEFWSIDTQNNTVYEHAFLGKRQTFYWSWMLVTLWVIYIPDAKSLTSFPILILRFSRTNTKWTLCCFPYPFPNSYATMKPLPLYGCILSKEGIKV